MHPLSIAFSEIYEEGITRHFVVSGSTLGMADSEVAAVQPVEIDCQLMRIHRDVVVHGFVETALRLVCGRCTEEFVLPLRAPLEAVYLPAQMATTEREKELEDGGADVYCYREHLVDLGEMVRDKLLLSIPLQPICRMGCRGLCPFCGVNWNLNTCQCAQAGLGSPFHLLRELRF